MKTISNEGLGCMRITCAKRNLENSILKKALEYIASGMADSSEKDKFQHARFYAADTLAKLED